jgi:hypothetical protein
MGSQQRSPLMPNERFTRGSAVSDGVEEPSKRAELFIFLKNEPSGETAIWRPEDDRTDDNVSWVVTFLRWCF